MVGHICRFNPRYAAAKREIDSGAIGKIVSIYARRNIPASVSETVLAKIGPIIGDGVHDTDLMLWFTGANIPSQSIRKLTLCAVFAIQISAGPCTDSIPEQSVSAKTLGSYPRRRRIRSMSAWRSSGPKGSLHIQETGPNFSVRDRNGWRLPDTTYWPTLPGQRSGAIREELAYFANCVLKGEKPDIITPEESLEAVRPALQQKSQQRGASSCRYDETESL